MSLAEKFGIDITELSSGQNDRLISALTEALSDPLFETYSPSLQELKLVTQNAPAFAHALIAAHQAYRRGNEQLASLDDRLGAAPSQEVTPYDEVRDFFHFVDNYIHDLDLAAEQLATELKLGEGENYAALSGHLEAKHGVRVVRGEAGDEAIRRFDPVGRILTVSRYASAPTRDFQIAIQIAQLAAATKIDQVLKQANFRSEEAVEICRMGLYNYFAGALILPYRSFLTAARDLRHDIELLAARFEASLEQVCHRLSTLQRPGLKGVPIFFARIDRAGNITKRHSAARLQFARFGAACPLWNAHQAFETPGRIIRQTRKRPMACAISASPRRCQKAPPASAPPIRAMPWRSAARSPMPAPSSMPTTSTSPTAAPSTRSASPAASASASNAPAARAAAETQAGGGSSGAEPDAV